LNSSRVKAWLGLAQRKDTKRAFTVTKGIMFLEARFYNLICVCVVSLSLIMGRHGSWILFFEGKQTREEKCMLRGLVLHEK
jgi:hypothetical protein